MVELPTGEVIERRRGGAGVLATLLIDATRLGTSGYIRVERATQGGFVGQIGILDGRPAFALADGETGSLQTGRDAYESTESASSFDDARISTHVEVDIDLVMELHPYARLLESDVVGEKAERWWAKGVHGGLNEPPSRIGGWARIRSEFELSADAAADADGVEHHIDETPSMTVLGRASAGPGEGGAPSSATDRIEEPAEDVEVDDGGPRLEHGTAWSIDGSDPSTTLAMARGLALRGAPLMVISRIPPERIRSEHGIPEAVIKWLSETPGDPEGIDPHLEIVLRELEGFLYANAGAVCVLDGLEFLSGLHGFDRVMGFIHDIADMVAATDDLLLCPIDLLAWDPKQGALITADLSPIPAEVADRLAVRPELMEGHPFLEAEPPDAPMPPLASSASTGFDGSGSDTTSFEHGVMPMPLQDDGGPSRFSISGLISSMKAEEQRSGGSGAAAAVGDPSPAISEAFERGLSDGSPSVDSEADAAGEGGASLPAWATAPSPNMMDAPSFGPLDDESASDSDGGSDEGSLEADATDDGAAAAEEGAGVGAIEPVVMESGVDEDALSSGSVEEVREEAEVSEEEPIRRMRDPTIDHKRKGRGLRRKPGESDARLSGLGLRTAVERAGEAPSLPSSPMDAAPDGGLLAADAIGIDLPELGDSVRTPLDATGTTWAAANAKEVADGIPDRPSEAVRMAIRAHPSSAATGRVSPTPSGNPMATQRAAVEQRRIRRIKTFVRLEGSAHEEEEVNVYERIGVLVDAGIDVGDLLALLEIDRNAAITRLERMEGDQ